MTPRPVRARLVVVVAAATAALVLAACTSSATSGSPSSAPTPTGSTSTPVDTTTPSTDVSSTDSASVITSGPTSTAAATTSAPIAASSAPTQNTCPDAQLTVRVLVGSGAQQQEFALVTITNNGPSACTMIGYPTVSLLAAGAQLGSPATPDTASPPHLVQLAAGEQAQAMLTDFSSCQSPLSDTVRVYPPGSTSFVDRPAQLRGCRITIAAVTHA